MDVNNTKRKTECVGDVLHVFDLLESGGEDQRKSPYKRRWTALVNLLTSGQAPHLELVPTALKPKEKAQMWDQLREANKEGVVFNAVEDVARRVLAGTFQHPEKAAIKSAIVQALGDDEDGIASTMEDFGL